MTAAILLDPNVEHRACRNCGHSVNDQGMGENRGWIHTMTSQYRCPLGPFPRGEGFASPSNPLDEEASEDDYESGVEQGRDEIEEIKDELSDAVEYAGDDASADELRNALTRAWKRIRL